jgi:hypothetical protein
MITTSQIEKCGSSGSSVLGQEGGLRIMNRPLCSRRQVRQGKSFGKQGKSCFPKNCRSLPGDKHKPCVELFGLRIYPTEGKKTLLGALRALSEAGGSFFIKYA